MNSIDSAARLAVADSELKRMLDAVVAQVREVAQREIMPRFLRVVHDQRKDDGSFCSEADLAAEHFLHGRLLEIRDCPIIGEEMTAATQREAWHGGSNDDNGLWCIDPIDGTTNFANGIPLFAVSIAYLIDHEPVIGVVYNPITDESFYAARGAGAFLNGTELPLRAGATELRDAVAGVDFKRISHHLGDELAVRPPYYSQRNFGSSALEWCFVAAGRLDVYLHGGQMLWDYAAGRLILAEAGGIAEALDGGVLMSGPAIKRGVIAATSPALFAEWSAWVKARS